MNSPKECDFDEQTMLAMTEVATLLRAAQETNSMARTFKNAPELDKEAANPFAKEIIVFSKDASRKLLRQMFKPKEKREAGLIAVRHRLSQRLSKAVKSAQTLADMEVAGIGPRGGKGNVIRKMVLEPLGRLEWK